MCSIANNPSRLEGLEQFRVDNKESYRLMVEASPFAISVIQDEVFVYANPAALRIFKAENSEDLLGKPISSLIHPCGLTKILERIERLLSGEKFLHPVEDRFVRLDGSDFPVEVTAASFPYNGKSAIQVIALDITEKKKAEKQLANEAIQRKFLIEKSRDGIVILDSEGKVVDANLRASAMLGYTQEEFEQITVFDWDKQLLRKKMHNILNSMGKEGEIFETIHTRKDGSKLNVEVSVSGTFFMGRKLIFCVVRDITERKKAEKELADWALQRRLLIEQSKDGIVVIDHTGKVREANLGFTEMLGYTQQEASELYVWDWETKFSKKELLKMLHDVDEKGDYFESKHKRKDGSVFNVEISSNGAYFNNEKLIFCVCRDITKRKEAEQGLKETLESLRQAIGMTIEVLIRTTEMRDPYTAGHQKRVSDLSKAIAKEMGLPSDQIQGLWMAANIHDIGKLFIPSEILSKSSLLTELEYLIIKEHPRHGHEILKNIPSPWPIAEIVYQHHEKVDGSGYPQGLKGDQILLEARIICVADVVEAMASHRPYRPALGLNAALQEIEKQKGILYDAQVVDACLKLFREKKFSFQMDNK